MCVLRFVRSIWLGARRRRPWLWLGRRGRCCSRVCIHPGATLAREYVFIRRRPQLGCVFAWTTLGWRLRLAAFCSSGTSSTSSSSSRTGSTGHRRRFLPLGLGGEVRFGLAGVRGGGLGVLGFGRGGGAVDQIGSFASLASSLPRRHQADTASIHCYTQVRLFCND